MRRDSHPPLPDDGHPAPLVRLLLADRVRVCCWFASWCGAAEFRQARKRWLLEAMFLQVLRREAVLPRQTAGGGHGA